MTDRDNAATDRGKRAWGLVFFGVFWTLFSSVFVALGLWMAWKAVAIGGWDKVPCEIERFEIRADLSGNPVFQPDLVFHYQVDGRKYRGTKLWTENKGTDDHEDLAELREEVLASPAECRVNPDNPAESSLLGQGPGELAGGLAFAVFGGLFMLIGIALIKGGISGSKPGVSRSKPDDLQGCLPLALFFLFGGTGVAVMGALVIPKTLEWVEMRGWEPVDAEIIWSRVKSKSDSDGTTYAVDLFYRYQMNGREYRSNRYDLLGGSSSGSKGKREVVRNHPRGSKLTVYVDPDEPWRAVVKRNPGWWGLFALFPLPFIAIGVGGLVWHFRKRRGGESVSKPGRARAAAGRGRPVALAAGKWTRFGSSRIGVFLAVLFFALFWNGIISFGVRDAWSDLGSDSGGMIGRIFGGGLALFMVPFVLVGAGLILLALYQLVAIFSPRYEIQLAGDDLTPGRSTPVRWRRAGGGGQPADFTLLLIGREEAEVARGSKRSTLRSVFHEQVLFETTVPMAMAGGRAELRVPADSACGFKGSHFRIRWFLCLRARVPRRPDLREEIEITVRPFGKEELP